MEQHSRQRQRVPRPRSESADCEQLRALLAAKIIAALDDRKLTVRGAHEVTGVAAADFSRIRKANLGRFTIDRLMTILIRSVTTA